MQYQRGLVSRRTEHPQGVGSAWTVAGVTARVRGDLAKVEVFL